MKKITLIFSLLTCTHFLFAQNNVSFDQLSFTEPANWTFTDNGSYHTYTNINRPANTFCIISLYSSTVSSGDANTDFQTAWSNYVVAHFKVNKNPTPRPQTTAAGISYLQDEAFVFTDNGNLFVRLLVFDLRGKCQSVLFLSVNENGLAQYKPDLDNFLASLKSNNTITTNDNISFPASDKNGITAVTTNFDDGWVATPKEDYILLTKNNYTVHLYYGEKFTDESRDKTVDYFYTHQLLKEYTIITAVTRSDQWHYYIEGEGKENSTGKKCYLAMDVVAQSGIARTVIAISPTQAEHKLQFGNDLKNMLPYNRFGVTQQGMVGTWKAGSGSSISYYNYSTGDYTGSNAVVMSDKFVFNSNSSFEAEFKGATGMVGAMRTYQQHYKGKFSVLSPWQISTTDQDNKTVVYDCWFEAVKGGMIFHLTNHQYTGSTFDLVKEK